MKLWILAVMVALLSACNYNKVKDAAGRGDGDIDLERLSLPDYATVNSLILGPKCVSCHSSGGGNDGGVNLETYANVRAQINRIIFVTVESREMPPRTPLSERENQLLTNWADAGAPETVVGIGEKPDLSIEKGPNDWAKLNEKFFVPKCVACHSSEQADGGVDLSTLAAVKANAAKVFESVIIKGTMPLEPYPAVTPPERRVLLKWFDAGMPQ